MKSFKVGVNTFGDDMDALSFNGLRFLSEGAATDYGFNLQNRWTAVRYIKIVESEDEPNA